MNQINMMIVALFVSNKISMKHSENDARLLIAKLTLALMVWIWLSLLIRIICNEIKSISFIFNPSYSHWIVFAATFLIVHYCTWKLSVIESVADDAQNNDAVVSAKRQLLWLFIIGFILYMTVAVYYKK